MPKLTETQKQGIQERLGIARRLAEPGDDSTVEWYALDVGTLLAAYEELEAQQCSQEYNFADPADCHRFAIDPIKRSAGLCASACGALADGDDSRTGKARIKLLDCRHTLNTLAHWLEHRILPQEGKKNL